MKTTGKNNNKQYYLGHHLLGGLIGMAIGGFMGFLIGGEKPILAGILFGGVLGEIIGVAIARDNNLR